MCMYIALILIFTISMEKRHIFAKNNLTHANCIKNINLVTIYPIRIIREVEKNYE